jgi:hypothetical protein
MNNSKKKFIFIALGYGLCFIVLCLIINHFILWKRLASAKKRYDLSTLQAVKDKISNQLSDSNNGYLILKQFGKKYYQVDSFRKISNPFVSWHPPLTQPVQPFFIPHAKDIIQKNKTAIHLLNQFNDKQIKYSINPDNILGETGYGCNLFHDALALIIIKAQIAATENNANSAIETILIGLTLLKNQQNSSFYYHNVFFNHWASRSMIEAIEIMLNITSFNDEQLAKLYKKLKKLDSFDQQQLKWAIKIKTLQGLNACKKNRKIWQDHYVPLGVKLAYSSNWLTGVLLFNQLQIISINYNFLNNIDLPFKERKLLIKKQSRFTHQYWYLLTFWATWNAIAPQELSTIAAAKLRLHCTLTGIAVERYRLKYKKLPENLYLLIPEFMNKIPINPFTDKLLNYTQGEFKLSGYKFPSNYKIDKISSLFGDEMQQPQFPKKITIKRKGCMIYGFTDKSHAQSNIKKVMFHLLRDPDPAISPDR